MIDTIDDGKTKRKNGKRKNRKGGSEQAMTDSHWKHYRGWRPPAVGTRKTGFRYRSRKMSRMIGT